MTRDAAGNVYGTTFFGGADTGCDIYFGGCGTVFKFDDSGTETVLHSFDGAPDGSNPTARVILDAYGILYGTTAFGGEHGHGTVFKVDGTGRGTILHSFAVAPMARPRTRDSCGMRPEMFTAPRGMGAAGAMARAAEPYSS